MWAQVLAWITFPYVLAVVLIWRSNWSSPSKWGATGILVVAAITVLVVSSGHERPEPIAERGPGVTENSPSEGGYSDIALINVEYIDGEVLIEGKSDLPDGSMVNVGFNVPTEPNDPYIGVDQEVTLDGGTFSLSLEPPQRREFERGPYVIEVLFTPKGQSPDVVALVGENGENLSGPLVEESFGFNVMKLKEQSDLKLAINTPSYPFDQSAQFPSDSPEYVVAQFAAAWSKKDWDTMAAATQITWRDAEDDPGGTLRDWYGFKTVRGFEILNVTSNSDVSADVTFRVWYEVVTNQIEEHKITGRALKESAPNELNPAGIWGVNPLSTLRES